MRVPPVTPTQIRDLAADGVGTVQRIVSSAPRVSALLDAGEALLQRITKLVGHLEMAGEHAQVLIDQADATQALARSVVAQVGTTCTRMTRLLDQYEPSIHALQPTITRLAETFTDADVDALITTVRRSPQVADHVSADVIPVIETLKTVAPDLTELLAVSRALNEILGSVPGLSRAKKRVDEELQSED